MAGQDLNKVCGNLLLVLAVSGFHFQYPTMTWNSTLQLYLAWLEVITILPLPSSFTTSGLWSVIPTPPYSYYHHQSGRLTQFFVRLELDCFYYHFWMLLGLLWLEAHGIPTFQPMHFGHHWELDTPLFWLFQQ